MTWPRGALADFMGDSLVYRSLEPMDRRIAGLKDTWQGIGLDHYFVPRKTTLAYATALLRFLQQAQQARGVTSPLVRALFVGDTAMNDGTAARNVGQYLPMMGFIGADRLAHPARQEIQDRLLLANRWEMLGDYVAWISDAGFGCDEQTVLLIDLDKTSLGARGRNDHVIDSARVQAVKRTMVDALGDRFDEKAFRAIYNPLNQPDYHYFTADNQDYLAYICLMVAGGIYQPEALWHDLRTGEVADIQEFVGRCDEKRGSMSPGLRQAQDEVCQGIAAEDPTPFKGFRRGEYFETVAKMDVLPDDSTPAQVLASEIVITAEVASVATYMASRGVLVFGISDKPDEASVPTAKSAAEGYLPIHRTPMKVYGSNLALA